MVKKQLSNPLSNPTNHILLLPVIIMMIVTYFSAFKNGKQTCDNYILNTYLYTITYLFLLGYASILFSLYSTNLSLTTTIILLILYVIVYIALLTIPNDKQLLKHLVSILYIVLAAFLLNFIFIVFDSTAIATAILLSIALFIVLSIIAFKFKTLISSKISLTFVIIFFVMIFLEFFISMFYPSSMIEKVIILVVLMIICYLVLTKTKKMIENEANCAKEGANYVNDSIGFILSFQNILLRILDLRKGKLVR